MRQEEWMEYLEAEEGDLKEAEALLDGTKVRKIRKLTKKKIVVLLAACMLMAGCLAAAAAGTQKGAGPLTAYFQASDEKTKELLAQLELESGMTAEDAGYVMEVTEAASDGKSVFAVVTMTAPMGVVLDGERYALYTGIHWIMTDAKGNGYSCSGGGGINEMERPAQNQVAFMLEWDFRGNLKGKKLVLEITGIVEENGEEQHVLAEGNWTLVMDVPKSRTKSRLQWTRVEAGEDIYYVYKVEVTPLGIHIYAVRRPGKGTATSKESFFELPVTVGYRDGSTGKTGGEAAGSGGLFCEKVVHYGDGRLMDPEDIREIRLGEKNIELHSFE